MINYIHRQTGCLHSALQHTSPAMGEYIRRETGMDIPPLWYVVWSGIVWVKMSPGKFEKRFKPDMQQEEMFA